MSYLLYAIFKIPMILSDEFITRALYDTVIQGYFRRDPSSMYGNFSLYFPTMASEKAGVVASSKIVSGFPTMAPKTSLDDALGVYGAFEVHDALGVYDA